MTLLIIILGLMAIAIGVIYRTGVSGDETARKPVLGGRSVRSKPMGPNSKAPNGHIMSIAISPDFRQDQTLFASGYYNFRESGPFTSAFFKSTNGGRTWEKILRRENADIDKLPHASAEARDKNLFIGEDEILYESRKNGTDRRVQVEMFVDVIAFSPDYAADDTVFVSGGSVIKKSTDRGKTWLRVDRDRVEIDIWTMVLSPNYTQDQTVFVGGEYGFYRSNDGGSNWHPAERNIPEYEHFTVASMGFSPDYKNDRTIFVGTSEGVFKSTNAGGSWEHLK